MNIYLNTKFIHTSGNMYSTINYVLQSQIITEATREALERKSNSKELSCRTLFQVATNRSPENVHLYINYNEFIDSSKDSPLLNSLSLLNTIIRIKLGRNFFKYLHHITNLPYLTLSLLLRRKLVNKLKLIKETQSNMSQVSIECIDKVIQNALIFYAR